VPLVNFLQGHTQSVIIWPRFFYPEPYGNLPLNPYKILIRKLLAFSPLGHSRSSKERLLRGIFPFFIDKGASRADFDTYWIADIFALVALNSHLLNHVTFYPAIGTDHYAHPAAYTAIIIGHYTGLVIFLNATHHTGIHTRGFLAVAAQFLKFVTLKGIPSNSYPPQPRVGNTFMNNGTGIGTYTASGA
jgi:hypothetical protein